MKMLSVELPAVFVIIQIFNHNAWRLSASMYVYSIHVHAVDHV